MWTHVNDDYTFNDMTPMTHCMSFFLRQLTQLYSMAYRSVPNILVYELGHLWHVIFTELIDTYFLRNVNAAIQRASTPAFIVGCITGANKAE